MKDTTFQDLEIEAQERGCQVYEIVDEMVREYFEKEEAKKIND